MVPGRRLVQHCADWRPAAGTAPLQAEGLPDKGARPALGRRRARLAGQRARAWIGGRRCFTCNRSWAAEFSVWRNMGSIEHAIRAGAHDGRAQPAPHQTRLAQPWWQRGLVWDTKRASRLVMTAL